MIRKIDGYTNDSYNPESWEKLFEAEEKILVKNINGYKTVDRTLGRITYDMGSQITPSIYVIQNRIPPGRFITVKKGIENWQSFKGTVQYHTLWAFLASKSLLLVQILGTSP